MTVRDDMESLLETKKLSPKMREAYDALLKEPDGVHTIRGEAAYARKSQLDISVKTLNALLKRGLVRREAVGGKKYHSAYAYASPFGSRVSKGYISTEARWYAIPGAG